VAATEGRAGLDLLGDFDSCAARRSVSSSRQERGVGLRRRGYLVEITSEKNAVKVLETGKDTTQIGACSRLGAEESAEFAARTRTS